MENKISSLLYFFLAVLILAKVNSQSTLSIHESSSSHIHMNTRKYRGVKQEVWDYKPKVCVSKLSMTLPSNFKILYWPLLSFKYLNNLITILQKDHIIFLINSSQDKKGRKGKISHPATRIFFSLYVFLLHHLAILLLIGVFIKRLELM